jgi:hypothetical protein
MRCSWAVMETGDPTVVMRENRLILFPLRIKPMGLSGSALEFGLHAGISLELREQFPRSFVDDSPDGFTINALQQAGRHFRPIRDERTQALGIEHQVKEIARWLSWVRCGHESAFV